MFSLCVTPFLRGACRPCSMNRMVGYDTEADSMDSDKLRHYILGGHVADYMRYLNEEDEEKYKAHFSRFIKEGVTADSVWCTCGFCDNPCYWFCVCCRWRNCIEALIRRSEQIPLHKKSRLKKM